MEDETKYLYICQALHLIAMHTWVCARVQICTDGCMPSHSPEANPCVRVASSLVGWFERLLFIVVQLRFLVM